MEYNILHEPWIRVRTEQKRCERVSLLDALEHADKYLGLVYHRPMEEFSVFLFLTSFVMDAYATQRALPDDDDEDGVDRWDGIEKGIDMSVIHRYVKWCEAQGISFDLLDKERPFMQIPVNSALSDMELGSVAEMVWTMGKGNNKKYILSDASKGLPMEDVMCALLTATRYAASGAGRSWRVNLNDSNFFYVRFAGDNLQQLIVRNLLRLGRKGCDINDGYGVPCWREMEKVNRDTAALTDAEVGFLTGLFFPRCVYRIIEENGKVFQVWYAHGWDQLCSSLQWIDPYCVAYVNHNSKNDRKFKTFRADSGNMTLCYTLDEFAFVLKTGDEVRCVLSYAPLACDKSNVAVECFLTCNSNSSWVSDRKETQVLPLSSLRMSPDSDLFVMVQAMKGLTLDKKAHYPVQALSSALKNVVKMGFGVQTNSMDSKVAAALELFYDRCKSLFIGELCKISGVCSDYVSDGVLNEKGVAWLTCWHRILSDVCEDVFDETVASWGNSSLKCQMCILREKNRLSENLSGYKYQKVV